MKVRSIPRAEFSSDSIRRALSKSLLLPGELVFSIAFILSLIAGKPLNRLAGELTQSSTKVRAVVIFQQKATRAQCGAKFDGPRTALFGMNHTLPYITPGGRGRTRTYMSWTPVLETGAYANFATRPFHRGRVKKLKARSLLARWRNAAQQMAILSILQ